MEYMPFIAFIGLFVKVIYTDYKNYKAEQLRNQNNITEKHDTF